MSESALQFRPTKRQKGYADDIDVGVDEFKDYDASLKAMMFEAKVQPSDRSVLISFCNPTFLRVRMICFVSLFFKN